MKVVSTRTSRTEMVMHRTFLVCAALGTMSLLVSPQAHADDASYAWSIRGTYAFTLAENCVQQASFGEPSFDNDFTIEDPAGAMTYGGASNGIMVFDGKGKVNIYDAAATNIFNSSSFLAKGSIPLGFGFGPALPFTCTGNYAVTHGNISANFVCTAVIAPTNAGNLPPHNPNYPNVITGFQSTFNMTGIVPQNTSSFVLTDLGKSLQSVVIFVNGGSSKGGSDVMATRVCTRATTLDRISP